MGIIRVLIGKHTWPVNSAVLRKLKDFTRTQSVTYAVEVVVSQKWCKIETLLLQTTVRKTYGLSNCAISDDLRQ